MQSVTLDQTLSGKLFINVFDYFNDSRQFLCVITANSRESYEFLVAMQDGTFSRIVHVVRDSKYEQAWFRDSDQTLASDI